MSAAQQVLSLPEVLSLILEYLEFDRAALYSAHLVNTTWARYTHETLWRNAPLSSLAAIEPARQQQYANMIRVSFSWTPHYPGELDKLSFPLLERCLFDAAELFNLPDMRLILPPFFKSSPQYLNMWLKCEDVPENLHDYRRQGLWEDKLDRSPSRRRHMTAQGWSFILQGPKLRSLICGKRPGEKKAGQLLARLASHEIYEEFFFYAIDIDLEAVDFLLNVITKRPIFPNLKYFGAFVRGDAIRILFPYLPRTLSSLVLCVGSLAGPYFDLATQFTCLESLTMVGCEDILGVFSVQCLVSHRRYRRTRAPTSSQTNRPGPDATALTVVACPPSPPVPGFVRMNRLPNNAIEQIFGFLVDCPYDVTNAMLISTLWHEIGDKVLHMSYSTKAAIKSPRAHLYPLEKLVFSLDDEDFHESNTVYFEAQHVEVVFMDELFVSNYISDNLRHLRVSCVNSLIPLNKASVELVNEATQGESHADLLLSLVDYAPGLETLIIDAHVFDVPQERLAYFFENAVRLNRFELSSPSGRIHTRAGLLRLLAKLPTLRTLCLRHIITLQDAQIMLQSTEWQGPTPFPGLETLTCNMELSAAEILLPHLCALRHLDITLHNKHSPRSFLLTNVFDSITKLTEMETLIITLPNNTPLLPAQALMSLASLKSIKVLRLNTTGLLRCGLSWYELTTLISNWSYLEKLDWTLQLS
ncbi:hypothetical protein KCU65_g5727, partial [Aureobasidium melanogenum]